ncbi:MAG: hypothetical protein ACI835_001087 [Planctomycetota bacterium]|jgi:hypothetical protein
MYFFGSTRASSVSAPVVEMQNSIPPRQAGQVLLTALFELAHERGEVRDALMQFSTWIQEELGNGEPNASERRDHDRPARVASAADAGADLGDKVLSPAQDRRTSDGTEHQTAEKSFRDVDLEMVVRRAAWKADACEWAIDHRKHEGEDLAELSEQEAMLRTRRESIEDCFAWMMDPYRRLPSDERLTQIASCYRNVALAATTTMELDRDGLLDPGPPSELLYLLAEVQSALLASLQEVDLRGDSDQRDLFLWLKDQTTRHRIYVDRHMRLDDPADFTAAEALAERITVLSKDIAARREARRRRGQFLNRVRYHLRKIAESDGSSPHDLEAVCETVDQWLESGLSQGDRTLRELLAPLADECEAESLGEGIAKVLCNGVAAGATLRDDRAGGRPELISRATLLLSGRRVLLFAGEETAEAVEALRDTLEISEVQWVSLEGVEDIQKALVEKISEGSYSLVLIGIRLAVSEYAIFKQLCIEQGKPFVRLPSGTSPVQVAHQVLRQVGRRLRSPALEGGVVEEES